MLRGLILLALGADITLRTIALSLEPISSSQFIGFQLYKNPGAIGSLAISMPLLITFTSGLLVLISYFRAQAEDTREKIGLELLFFGGLLNLLDRIMHGFTTDYLLLFGRSALNIADLLIFLGIAILASYTISNHPHKDAPRAL